MRVFLSYAQADQAFRDQLVTHLSLLRRDRILETWDAHEITGGTEKEQAIAQQLDAADIILLLISADFIASDRYDIEMQRAIERHENQEARVIPILLKPCDWQSAPFAGLEVLPKGGQPVTSGDTEAAFASIAQEIRRVAIELNPALVKPKKSPMKLGAPLPGVRLPDNFVERPEALNAVKALLLEESEKPLVVSAIAGLGGLGKSVLAAALVLDAEVQARFEDGILWVTLGQNPDLQSLLGDWIRTLDKSRESYSATTLESASRYLQTLLIDKRMLLVVDDVWNGAHVEHFRMGGAECRVLVTTREAQIDGAEYHALDLMSEEQAIDLVRRKLKRQWQADQEAEVKAFAKSLGYLPLALDLAANQVRDGFSWAELRSEFEAERRSVALDVLDSPEAWDCLDEAQQRKYSLRACFNLSLRRLSAEQLRQFAWLGVLPEDVTLDARMAMTLWALPKLQAKKALVVLKNRSFLTSGTETLEGEPTYRVHDLMHDTARGLIEQGTISSAIQTLPAAHAQLLERYRAKANDRWDQLPNDRYIHRHLTWHLEQAGLEDEIHALLAMSDEQGRNAWFEACDRIGQPAIFVQDVKRAWSIAEQSYEEESTRSIVLQCRYALITATLNTLVNNLPIGIIVALVNHKYWKLEQAWTYVEQIQDDGKIAKAILELAPYLSKSILTKVAEKARTIQNNYHRARTLLTLARIDKRFLTEAHQVLQLLEDDVNNALVSNAFIDLSDFTQLLEKIRSSSSSVYYSPQILEAISQIDPQNFTQLLEVVYPQQILKALSEIDAEDFEQWLKLTLKGSLKPEYNRAEVLIALSQVESADLERLAEIARILPTFNLRARVLSALAQVDLQYFSEALRVSRSIQDAPNRAVALSKLSRIDPTYLTEALEAIDLVELKYDRAEALTILTQSDPAYFTEALEAVNSIPQEDKRENALCALAQIGSIDFSQLLKIFLIINDCSCYAKILITLAQIDSAYFPEALEAACSIQDEYIAAQLLVDLARTDSADFSQLLEISFSIQSEFSRSKVLTSLVQIDSADLSQLAKNARLIQHASCRAKVLVALAKADSAYFAEALEAALFIPNNWSPSIQLCALAEIDPDYFSEAINIQLPRWGRSRQASTLINLAKIDPERYLSKALETVELLREQDKSNWQQNLYTLIKFLSPDDYYSAMLKAAQSIQDDIERAGILIELAQMDAAEFEPLLECSRSIQDQDQFATVVNALAQVNSANFEQLLKEIQLIETESRRAEALIALAPHLPEAFLSSVFDVINTITHKPTYAQAVSAYIPRLSLDTVSPTDWQSYLHILAHRTRTELMEDLATLYPTIVHLGGKEAVRDMVDAMREVCQQWK